MLKSKPAHNNTSASAYSTSQHIGVPSERRRYFRLRYPLEERLMIRIGLCCFELVEISEEGIRVDRGHRTLPPIGFEVSGILYLRDRQTLTIAGDILREDGHEVIVHLHERIPEKVILDEQRYILRKYRHL